MRLVIQRAAQASVTVDGKLVSEIGKGLFILVGVEVGDTEEDMKWLASKAVGMRIFDDENGVIDAYNTIWTTVLLRALKRKYIDVSVKE